MYITHKRARVLCIYRSNKDRLELLSYLKSVSHIINIVNIKYSSFAQSLRGKYHPPGLGSGDRAVYSHIVLCQTNQHQW